MGWHFVFNLGGPLDLDDRLLEFLDCSDIFIFLLLGCDELRLPYFLFQVEVIHVQILHRVAGLRLQGADPQRRRATLPHEA